MKASYLICKALGKYYAAKLDSILISHITACIVQHIRYVQCVLNRTEPIFENARYLCFCLNAV